MLVLLPVWITTQAKAIIKVNRKKKKNQIRALYYFQFILVRPKTTKYALYFFERFSKTCSSILFCSFHGPNSKPRTTVVLSTDRWALHTTFCSFFFNTCDCSPSQANLNYLGNKISLNTTSNASLRSIHITSTIWPLFTNAIVLSGPGNK